MKPNEINPMAIKEGVKSKSAAVAPKAAFSDIMQGVSAMGPASSELVGQWSGWNEKAGAVLNAAFSGVNVTGAQSAMGSSYGYGGMGSYSASPGVMGSSRYSTQTGFTNSKYSDYSSSLTSVDDPAAYQQELMTTMNQNNLKLLELQALMQSNMQSWTTKSNILSADHRARMSMVEKFTARG